MSDLTNRRVAIEVMGWEEPKRDTFGNSPEGQNQFHATQKDGLLFDQEGKLTYPPDFLIYKYPCVIERMRDLGFRLKLVEYSDGWYALFCSKINQIEEAEWQASQLLTPGAAVCYAALRRCQG